MNSEKQIKQYSTKSCANEQLQSVKDDIGYLAQVAQMNGEIDTDYSQRPHIFFRNLLFLCCREIVMSGKLKLL